MIAKDKLLHVGLGILAIACAMVALMVHALFGLGPMLAYTTTVVGLLYEVQQAYRKEGTVDPWDAAATALPGFVAWGFLTFIN